MYIIIQCFIVTDSIIKHIKVIPIFRITSPARLLYIQIQCHTHIHGPVQLCLWRT